MKSAIVVIAIVIAGLGLGGCAAIGLVGASAFSAGAGAAVDAGREYARGGVVYRTFSLPLHELRLALGQTLERMELAVVRDEMEGVERRILARARDREIEIRLQPVTRTVTRLRLVVAEGLFRKDRATTTEIVTQTEHAVDERVAASVQHGGPATHRRASGATAPQAPSETGRVRRGVPGTGASSPARDGPR